MDMTFEDQVRERAYHIWLAGGMTDGQAHEHWVCAEEAVKACESEVVELEAVAPKTAKPKAAAKPTKAQPAAAKAAPAKSAAPKTTAKVAKGAKKAGKAEMVAH